MSEEAIKIFVSGDFAPRMRVSEAISTENYHILFNDILPIIKSSDIAITNLESPLIDEGTPIAKIGPNLKAPLRSIEAVKFAGLNMVTLANNHVMDYGDEGLKSTISVCDTHGVIYIGAGKNLLEAQTIRYFTFKGKTVAFLNCCENEWGTTHGDGYGCNPLDEIGIYYQIQKAKGTANYIVLIIHGGHENYEYPSPRMKKLYRWFIDLGVDAVVGNHTHCFSGYEFYKDKPIFYSLGNFIFDGKQRNSLWNIGAAVVLELSDNKIEFQLYPYTQCNTDIGVHLFNDKAKKQWIEQEKEKSNIIKDDCILKMKFEQFVEDNKRQYLNYLEQSKCRFIAMAKNRNLLPKNLSRGKKLLYLNIIRDESHRDIVINLLNRQ